jgi:hypothetical protein
VVAVASIVVGLEFGQGQHSVWGSDGELKHEAGHIDFPGRVFKKCD